MGACWVSCPSRHEAGVFRLKSCCRSSVMVWTYIWGSDNYFRDLVGYVRLSMAASIVWLSFGSVLIQIVRVTYGVATSSPANTCICPLEWPAELSVPLSFRKGCHRTIMLVEGERLCITLSLAFYLQCILMSYKTFYCKRYNNNSCLKCLGHNKIKWPDSIPV